MDNKQKDLFREGIKSQELRLSLLKKSKIINQDTYIKLTEINGIRNKYIHLKKVGKVEDDSLKVLRLFIEILNSRFSERFIINKEGRIVDKDNSQTYSVKVD
ncbi:MAG: hypothetical protein AABY06_02825 [Nanoarchaeota archaeon]